MHKLSGYVPACRTDLESGERRASTRHAFREKPSQPQPYSYIREKLTRRPADPEIADGNHGHGDAAVRTSQTRTVQFFIVEYANFS
jgi:hypothetical protein